MKINIKQVLSEAVNLCIHHYKRVLIVSLILFVYSIFSIVLNEAFNIKNTNSFIYVGLAAVYILLVITIVFLPIFHMAALKLINSFIDNASISLKEAYIQTRGKYGSYIGCGLLMGLIYIPVTILIYALKAPIPTILQYIYYAFSMSIFYLVMPMIALEPKTSHYIKKSVSLLKGNYLTALVLTLIISTFPNIIKQAGRYLIQDKFLLQAFNTIFTALNSCLLVLSYVVNVIVYRQLNKKALTQWRE